MTQTTKVVVSDHRGREHRFDPADFDLLADYLGGRLPADRILRGRRVNRVLRCNDPLRPGSAVWVPIAVEDVLRSVVLSGSQGAPAINTLQARPRSTVNPGGGKRRGPEAMPNQRVLNTLLKNHEAPLPCTTPERRDLWRSPDPEDRAAAKFICSSCPLSACCPWSGQVCRTRPPNPVATPGGK